MQNANNKHITIRTRCKKIVTDKSFGGRINMRLNLFINMLHNWLTVTRALKNNLCAGEYSQQRGTCVWEWISKLKPTVPTFIMMKEYVTQGNSTAHWCALNSFVDKREASATEPIVVSGINSKGINLLLRADKNPSSEFKPPPLSERLCAFMMKTVFRWPLQGVASYLPCLLWSCR